MGCATGPVSCDKSLQIAKTPTEDEEERREKVFHLHKPYCLMWIFRLSFGDAYVQQIQTGTPVLVGNISPVSGMRRLVILGSPRCEKFFSRHAVDLSRLWRMINQTQQLQVGRQSRVTAWRGHG